MTTSLGSYMMLEHRDAFHSLASFAGVFIGGVTFTGSLAAYRKLAGLFPKDKMNLPYAGSLNRPLMLVNAGALALTLKYPEGAGTLMLT